MGKFLLRQSLMSDGALAFRAYGTKFNTIYEAAPRALEFVAFSKTITHVIMGHDGTLVTKRSDN
jgi:hypothetical protein